MMEKNCNNWDESWHVIRPVQVAIWNSENLKIRLFCATRCAANRKITRLTSSRLKKFRGDPLDPPEFAEFRTEKKGSAEFERHCKIVTFFDFCFFVTQAKIVDSICMFTNFWFTK